jgi:nucleotide-binding universal stress UspA family protein
VAVPVTEIFVTFRPQKILCGTDFSPRARRAVDVAIDMAQTYSAQLILVHVDSTSVLPDLRVAISAPSVDRLDYQETARAKVRHQWMEEEKYLALRGAKALVLTRVGTPALEVAAIAREENVDLVVVGTHGHTGVRRILLGSVAEGIVRHCHAPVLTIRGPPESPPSAG